MATTTPRIGLTKPDGTDLVDIAVLNTNFDKIDSNIASTKIQSTKPTTANAGDLWWDSDTGTLYLYYTDANSSQWVAATSDPINIGVVANQTERDAQYPTPAQGMSVYRTDLGVTQRYYGLYNLSTNPGGRSTAGWYNTEKSVGLVPISPTSVSVAGGTATAESLGAVSFSSATSLTLNNVFTSNYTNYRIVLTIHTSTDGWIQARFATGGTTNTANSYAYGNFWSNSSATQIQASSPNTQILLHRVGTLAAAPVQMCVVDIVNPQQAAGTTLLATMNGWYATLGTVAGWFNASTQFDGFTIFPTSGSMGGRIQVFGYND